MDEKAEKILKTFKQLVVYVGELSKSIEELRTKYKGNKEIDLLAENLTDVLRPLRNTEIDYAKCVLSHLCNTESVELVSQEETEEWCKKVGIQKTTQ